MPLQRLAPEGALLGGNSDDPYLGRRHTATRGGLVGSREGAHRETEGSTLVPIAVGASTQGGDTSGRDLVARGAARGFSQLQSSSWRTAGRGAQREVRSRGQRWCPCNRWFPDVLWFRDCASSNEKLQLPQLWTNYHRELTLNLSTTSFGTYSKNILGAAKLT